MTQKKAYICGCVEGRASPLPEYDNYCLFDHNHNGFKGLTNKMLAPLDWASLDFGGEDYNLVTRKVLSKLKVTKNEQATWILNISRKVADLISYQAETAYVIEFAKANPSYDSILFESTHASRLFRVAVEALGLRIKELKVASKIPQEQVEGVNPTSEHINTCFEKEYIFFPHQSMFYGNLFVKDWPFKAVNPKETAIIEWDNVSERAANYYRKLGVTWTTWKKLSQVFEGGKKAKIKAGLNALTRNRLRWSRAYMGASYEYNCNTARRILANFSKARCAFIGFDVLFPPYISQGLRQCGIPSVGIEERPLSAYGNNQNVFIDHYIVSDTANERAWKRKPFSSIGQTYVGGHWRLETKVKPLQGIQDFILVTDYHTQNNSKWNYLINWDNYRQFYRDLLELASRCREYVFRIRTKLFMLEKIDPAIYGRLQKLGNVSWDLSEEMHRSYRLLRSCSIVFGRQTSLMDEARALSIPTVIHENFQYSMPYLENVSAEYASRFDISSSVDEAERLIRKRMSREHSLPVEPESKIGSILREILKQCPSRC